MLFWSLVIPVQRILLSSALRPPQQIGEGRTSRFYPRDGENPSYATDSVALSMGADFHRTMVATGGGSSSFALGREKRSRRRWH